MSGTEQKTCRIETFARAHLTLLDMGNEGYRRNGGIGFSISRPGASVVCRLGAGFRIEDRRATPLPPSELGRLTASVRKWLEKLGCGGTPVNLEISGSLPTHCGFGSGTALRLACLEAVAIILERPVTEYELVQASGRGGTSGVGITTYFHGGLSFDIGRASRDSCAIGPSSSLEGTVATPLVLVRSKMPAWEIGICIPSSVQILTEEEEKAFFQRTVPIKRTEVNQALYEAVYGILGAAYEGDFEVFCEALRKLQDCQWKRSERSLYGSPLGELESLIYRCGARVVAMSSLGPGLIFFGDDVLSIVERCRNSASNNLWFTTTPDNFGRRVEHA